MLRAAVAASFFLAVRGRAVAAPARRVVSLELLSTELLLTLGVTPVAIANRALYERLVAEPALPGSVEDLGPLTEPNAEFLQWLRPDAIVLASWQAGALQRLGTIAPLHPLQTFAGDVPAVAHTAVLLGELGQLTGHIAEAENWAERLDRTMRAAKEKLAPWSGRPLYVCRFAANGRNVAVFGGNGLIGDMLRQLELRNAWQGRINSSGVVSIGIERLAEEPEAHIVHFERGEETVRAMRNLERSPLWNALPAVRAGRVTTMPVIYPSGGVFSAIRFARQLAEALPEERRTNG